MTKIKAKSKAKKTKLKKIISKKSNNLVKVKATKDFLLRDNNVVLTGQIIELDKEYAYVLQKEIGFKII